jgi:hypothetical protein
VVAEERAAQRMVTKAVVEQGLAARHDQMRSNGNHDKQRKRSNDRCISSTIIDVSPLAWTAAGSINQRAGDQPSSTTT